MRVAALVVMLSLWPVLGHAHPGRLDADGCHAVRKDFTYKSGQVVRKGEFHCHRGAVGQPIILDGREVLTDPNGEARETREEEEESP